MTNVVVIPARGGSKGVPGKNLEEVGSYPLLAHSILQAKEAGFPGNIYVSTDSDDIARCAEQYGSQIIHRPAVISGDEASSEAALLHALREIEQMGTRVEYVIFLQCTSPFRTSEDIERAMKVIVDEQSDSLLSVVPNHRFLWQVTENGPQSINYDFRQRPRRQEMSLQFQENGSIYIFKPWVLKKLGNRLGGKISIVEMPEESAIDIDSYTDLEIARALYASKYGKV